MVMLVGQADILGLVSVEDFPNEFRLQIRLICASKENIGRRKQYTGIIGCLIAFVGDRALNKYIRQACISLVPKTELRGHYKREYGMIDGGPQLYLEGLPLEAIVNKYLK